MADQTYNLTQTGEEVQAIINDANGVKGAGATTSLTTDYIMLKDTSGAYHKIQKSSFTEAVRNTLASLLVNNDKGTTISQIAAIASGDFGSVTPNNLASVLGAQVDYITPFLAPNTPFNSDWTTHRGLWRLMPVGFAKLSSTLVFTVKNDDTITFLSTTWYSPNVTIEIVNQKFVITQNFNSAGVTLTLTKIA